MNNMPFLYLYIIYDIIYEIIHKALGVQTQLLVIIFQVGSNLRSLVNIRSALVGTN